MKNKIKKTMLWCWHIIIFPFVYLAFSIMDLIDIWFGLDTASKYAGGVIKYIFGEVD